MRPTVRGCLRCGSGRLRVPSASDGVVVGQLQDWRLAVCDGCGFVGPPLEFDDEAARDAYAASQRPP